MMLIMILHCEIRVILTLYQLDLDKEEKEKSSCSHCYHDGDYNTDETTKTTEENTQDVFVPKHRGSHYNGKNQHLKNRCHRNCHFKLKRVMVDSLQASQISDFLSKILGMRHVRYKLKLLQIVYKFFNLFNSLDYCISLIIAKSKSDGCIEYGQKVNLPTALTSTQKKEKVSIDEHFDIKSPENSKHKFAMKTLDDEIEELKKVKLCNNTTCHSDSVNDEVVVLNKSLSVKKEWYKNLPGSVADVNRYHRQRNKTGLMEIMDIILHPACHFSKRNNDQSIVVYPVVKSSVHSLMRYEILRIRSYNQISTMPKYSVTQLAQNGFYLSGQVGEVTCFNCEVSHKQFLMDIHLDDTAHGENCGRERVSKNVGLFMGTQGLTSDDLKLFNTVYGDNSDRGKMFIQQEPSEESQVFFVYTSADTSPIKTQIDPKSWRVLKEEERFYNDINDVFLDLRAAAYPLFANRKTRKETFVSWDPTHSQKPDYLVSLGFFYAGYSDCARCFYCGLGLKYWRPNDDAAFQHARFRPQCKYNQFVKGQEFIDDVQRKIAAENQGASADTDITEVPNLDQLMKSDAVKQVLDEGWSLQDVRAGVTQLIQDLGEECLVYDILMEILVVKGGQNGSSNAASPNEREGHDGAPSNQDSAMEVGDTESSQIDADNSNASSSVQSASESAANLDPEVVLRLLEREHNYLQKRLNCQVCGKNKIGCIYLPCGHVVACQKCGDLAATCILCSKVISAMASVYLS